MKVYIDLIFEQLNIHNFDDLYRRWENVLDMLFYFNKMNGCGVPSIEEVRRYL